MIGTYLSGRAALAIYASSFWHYYLYWLAYCFGAISLPVFKRDALTTKSTALLALGAAYLAVPLDLPSLVVVACGFLLNGIAAAALGSDRTYYGREIAGLPSARSTAFPYSVMSHPMLVGNAIAFGGTMINDAFREQWWPLACAHVAMNLGLLVMEVRVPPRLFGSRPADRLRRACSPRIACLAVAGGAALGAAVSRGADVLLAAGVGACMLAYTLVLYCCYASPAHAPGRRRAGGAEVVHE